MADRKHGAGILTGAGGVSASARHSPAPRGSPCSPRAAATGRAHCLRWSAPARRRPADPDSTAAGAEHTTTAGVHRARHLTSLSHRRVPSTSELTASDRPHRQRPGPVWTETAVNIVLAKGVGYVWTHTEPPLRDSEVLTLNIMQMF